MVALRTSHASAVERIVSCRTWLRAWCLGFRFKGLALRVEGAVFRVEGLGFRVKGWGLRG